MPEIKLTPEQEKYIQEFVDQRFPDKDNPRRESYAEQMRKAILNIQLNDPGKKN